MKILHVLTSARAEGTPKLVLDWLNGAPNINQTVLFLKNEPRDLINEFKNTNVDIYSSTKKFGSFFSRNIKIPLIVSEHCKMIKPDIVIAWNQPNIHLIMLGARMTGVKNLLGHAGCLPEKSKSTGWLYTYMVFFATLLLKGKIICPSEHIFSTFRKIPLFPKKTLYKIPNAINIASFINNENAYRKNVEKYTAINVGNLEEAKDQISLVKIWKVVINKNNLAKLFIVGGGSKEEELKTFIRNQKLENNVFLLGPRKDIPQLLQKADIFAFTSKNIEGFGTVLIEALATGMKIIAFNEPAANELLNSGQYGKLIHDRNIEIFASEILKSFDEPLNIEVNQKKIDYANSFNIKNMVDSYINLIHFK